MPDITKYLAMSQPPKNALKKIEFGALKGKSDINPQWRIETLTETFGLCGIGWKFEIASTTQLPCTDGQVMLYMLVYLYIKDGENWSEPIPGYGGDFLVEKNKNGLVPNDEAYKMCLTDALGNAAKYIGVAANIYRGLENMQTKYDRAQAYNARAAQQAPAPQQAAQQQAATPLPSSHVRKNGNRTEVLGANGWTPLFNMNVEQLQYIVNNPKYAAAAEEAKKILMTGAA